MRIRTLSAPLLPLILLLTTCDGAMSASTTGNTDGTGGVILDVGDQKGGCEAIRHASGELDGLGRRITWSTSTSGPPLLEAVNAEAVDIGGVGNTPPEDATKSEVIGGLLLRLQRAQDWVFTHPKAWAKVWAKETGLPYEVAPDAVERSHGTRVPVAVDPDAIACAQAIADTFFDMKLVPRRFSFKDYVDTRFNRDLPPSSTIPRPYRKASS
ncbi:hypothetical protein [Streptomyces sp. NPDC093149]|uniref:hypothetical protein n=1 Tax=Streptomyces sp. NPDC093149 TaxID=3366031 RepID=UPI00382E39CC